ncbi:MAG: winged helix-turn-helix transcriptional regulator [Arcobacteraceae bacterium]|nr:winged helix-turn-helix transcriptional regulator [Arcobacteraceae bacterium]
MLKVLLGSKTVEQVLQYLLAKEEGYIRGISKFYNIPAPTIKKQIDKLENGNVIVGKDIGNIRMYRLNKRYPFLKELVALLERAREAYPENELNLLLKKERIRPRRKDKTLNVKSDD